MTKKIPPLAVKPLRWVGPSKNELMSFPEAVRKAAGHALHEVQTGDKPECAKPLHGFGGAGVLEVVTDYASDTYRAVYTVKLADAVYVLHCFKKKSKKGIETPKHIIELIRERLKTASDLHNRSETYDKK